jgi:hypothetical protein
MGHALPSSLNGRLGPGELAWLELPMTASLLPLDKQDQTSFGDDFLRTAHRRRAGDA